jgi:hypothetical protein
VVLKLGIQSNMQTALKDMHSFKQIVLFIPTLISPFSQDGSAQE